MNNASFGVYAEIVRSPAYRDDKRGTTLAMLPDLLRADGDRHQLHVQVGGTRIDGPQAVLVSNNPYDTTDIAGLGRRDRLDTGRLGVIAVKVDNAAQAIGLVRGWRGHRPDRRCRRKRSSIDAPTAPKSRSASTARPS